MQFDLVIRAGQVFDGTGTAPYRASLGVSDGRFGGKRLGTVLRKTR